MIEELREKLKSNGQSLKWFYDSKIKGKIDITYGGFGHQLNGYAPLSEEIKQLMSEYING